MQYTQNQTLPFEAFYTRYHALVRRVFARFRDEQDDLIQETFVKAWRAYARLDPSQNVAGWLTRIASNVARDRVRQHQLKQGRDCPLETEEGASIDLPDHQQATVLALVEASDAIRYAYHQLCLDDQQVLALLFLEYTLPEIGARLHLDRDACRYRVQRARTRFQRYYQPGEEGR